MANYMEMERKRLAELSEWRRNPEAKATSHFAEESLDILDRLIGHHCTRHQAMTCLEELRIETRNKQAEAEKANAEFSKSMKEVMKKTKKGNRK